VNENTTRTHGRSWLPPSLALARYTAGGLGAGNAHGQRDETVRYGFKVGSIGLVTPPGLPCEVVDDATIFPIPNTAHWFTGMINLRGNLVPVFDLQAVFGIGAGGPRSLLVINRGAEAVAVPVDALPQAVSTGQKAPSSLPVPAQLEPFCRGGYLADDGIWLEVDFASLFQALGSSAGGL